MTLTFKEFLLELQSNSEINSVEQHLDNMFADMGIDVEFTYHFKERLLGREQSITPEEIEHAFAKLKELHGQKLMDAKGTNGYKAIIKDFQNSLNIVFNLQNDTLTNITVMRKPPNKFSSSDFPGSNDLKVW